MRTFTLALVLFATPALAETREEKVARCLKDFASKDAKARATAAEEIGKIAAVKSSYGKPALEPMLKLLKDKEPPVRAAAAEALGKLDEPKKVVPALSDLLKTEKSDAAKLGIVTGLGLVGESAKPCVPAIREVAQQARTDNNNRLAMACRLAVENINGGRKK